MIPASSDIEQLRSNLTALIARHRRTRVWFWRTGIASLAAAGLWILIYSFASTNVGIKETLAIIIGAILMWLLFLWSFLLLRRLNRLTAEVKHIEKRLIVGLSTAHLDKE